MMEPKILSLMKGLSLDRLPDFLSSLSHQEQVAILDDWDLWALPYQRMPQGKWRRWILRGGRGIGKGVSAAKATNEVARDREKIGDGEIGIVAPTYTAAVDICVEGPSGILKTARSDFRPTWSPGNMRLTWPNGVRGRVFTADAPERMRGPNWAWIWADELASWTDAENTWWEIIEPALRVAWARCVISMTPKPKPFLRELETLDDTVVSSATTYDNPYLSTDVRKTFELRYRNRPNLGRQEMLGEYVEETAEALWRMGSISEHRVEEHPDLVQIIVSVDPAISAHEKSDETGILVVGRGRDKHGYVLEDCTGKYKPHEWAARVIQLYRKYRADRVVAEINQGGDMVEGTIRAVDPSIAYESVRVYRGKILRAEPASALYERGLVHHVGVFPELEQSMCTWVPGMPSPDRIDALVQGLSFLRLGEQKSTFRAYL